MSAATGKNRVHACDFDACRMLILDIQALESRSHRLKMTGAAQALNQAKNAAGWELAEQIGRAQKDCR